VPLLNFLRKTVVEAPEVNLLKSAIQNMYTSNYRLKKIQMIYSRDSGFRNMEGKEDYKRNSVPWFTLSSFYFTGHASST
jgi:hypothetical protein